MYKVIVLLVVSVLSACQSKPTIELVPVPTPVAREITIPEIERPQLTINRLTDEQKKVDGEIAKAYLATLLELIHYSESLEQVVQSIKEQNQGEDIGLE